MQNEEDLASIMKNAQKLHGHLGPFLVLGVRMGMIAKKALNITDEQCTSLRANAKVPLHPPFSCLIDGIQASTSCTVGNQRLSIENSEEIRVNFVTRNSDRKVIITLNPLLAEELKNRLSEDALTEELALDLAHRPENKLFIVEMQ
jgi:formylmethanofuran dehydrogenase subunit E